MKLSHILPRRPGRDAFTLVELLVSLALCVFIMAILSEAFVKGMQVFGDFKAIADMEEKLRTAATVLRRDLRAPHFEGAKRLSECTVSGKPFPRLDGLYDPIVRPTGLYQNADEVAMLLRQLAPYRFKAPQLGFLSIEEWPNRPAPAGGNAREYMLFEGADSSGRPSYRDIYDVLHFTSRLEGNEPDKFFYNKVRVGSMLDTIGLVGGAPRYDNGANRMFSTKMAELLYFMFPDDTANMPGVVFGPRNVGPGPIQTFNLHRQVLGLVPDRFSNGAPIPAADVNGTTLRDDAYGNNLTAFAVDNDISAAPSGNSIYYNSLADVQHRLRRRSAGLARQRKVLPSGQADGSDILLTNVISFDVKVWDPFAYKIPLNPLSGRGAFVDIGDVQSTNVPMLNASDTPPPGGFGPNPYPTAAAVANDLLTPVFGGTVNNFNGVAEYFDTGTARNEGANLNPANSPPTHPFPITTIQITIRVWEPKSQQTRQITIIQDM